MTKILVTGSSGFIGKRLIAELSLGKYDVSGISSETGDITDKNMWDNIPYHDVVIHLAGLTFVPNSWKNPDEYLRVNIQGTIAALEYCRKHSSKFIFFSSYLYGNPDKLPISESADLQSLNPYALSKKLAEDISKFYSENFGLKVLIFRPFNIYGPNQAANFLIPFIIGQAIHENRIQVKDLSPRRDYIYIDDVVDAIVKGLNYNKAFGLFNLGSGQSYSVAEIIDLIQANLGKSLSVESSQETRQGEIMDTRADISKVQSELNWKPRWSLEDGLAEILKGL